MSFKVKIVLGGLAASALMIASTGVYANNAPVVRSPRSTAVHYGDLNLDRAGDVAALYGRISSAADRVCSSRASTGLYYTLPQYRSCVADATQKAVTDVHNTELTAYYEQQMRRTGDIKVAAQ